MKVLYFAPTSTLYGDNIALLNILSVLVKEKGVEPYIITSRKGEFTDKLDELGYNYSIMKFGQVLWPKLDVFRDYILWLPRIFLYLLWYNSFIYLFVSVKNIIKNFKPDLIHTNNSCIYTGLLVSKLFGIKHIQHIREFTELSYGRKYFPCKKYFFNKLKIKKNNNIFITKQLKELWNIDDSVLNRVIYDGVFSEKYSIKQNIEKELYFLYVGRLVKDKGILDLLKEFNIFCNYNKNIILKVVGDGADDYKHILKKYVLENNLLDRVEFLGYRKDVYILMEKAMAVFVPSYFEGFGFIPVEAMINGALVIVRNTTGLKEQFDNGVEILGEEICLRFNKNEEISVLMNEIVDNGIEYYYPMIERSQEAVKLYTIGESANKVYNFYYDILNN